MDFFQAKILEWVAISYSRRSSQPRDQAHVMSLASPALARGLLITSTTREALAHSKGTDNMIHMSKTVSYFKRTHD